MTTCFTSVLSHLAQCREHDLFSGIRRGVEKENLRVTDNGQLSQLDHPQAWGSALTNPFITTDFSEALPELITPPMQGLDTLEHWLTQLNAFVVKRLPQGEILWPGSMPPLIAQEQMIRLAEYGNSNVGQMKHVYRRGLSYRYGRMMQAIAGIHYNVSFPDGLFACLQTFEKNTDDFMTYRSKKYMQLVRNFFRRYWLVSYLFGASPVCMASSIPGEWPDFLQANAPQEASGSHATSLRMSELGYQNNAQAGLTIDYDSVQAYAQSLLHATDTPYPDFQNIGIEVDGVFRQLSDGLLQIENEYYSPIRPKQPAQSGEMPAIALCKRGVEYIEVRALDLNPFSPNGIDRDTMAFMDIFLLSCMLMPCQEMGPEECVEARDNCKRVVEQGRDPELMLSHHGQSRAFREWAMTFVQCMRGVAQVVDASLPSPLYVDVIDRIGQRIENPGSTPSGSLMAAMTKTGYGYADYMQHLGQRHADALSQIAVDSDIEAQLIQAVDQSLTDFAEQQTLKEPSFAEFLAEYFKQKKTSCCDYVVS